jgi:DNA gyrase/topoisomerase IV subunit A
VTSSLKWSSKIPQISQDTRYCLFVSSVRVQRVTPTPMYDFTVDTHENALIVTSRSKGQMTAVCVHNSAVYQTLVNMHWQNAPLLEGVGNFGDPPSKKPAAAARYTSVRSSSLLSEMFKDAPVTPMQPNYSAEFQEPTVIPTRVPNLLLNGTEGIAVGVTSNIPPHNLNELVDAALLVLKNPKTRLTTLLKRVKGPDYREGGRIVSKTEAIKELYDTGTGSLEFECLYTLTKVKGGYQLVVKSAAPTWSVSQFIDKCEKLVASNYITYVANESGEELRVVVFARQPNRLKDKVLPLLRKRVRYNWVALQDKKPLKLNLVTYLDRWLTWRQAVTKQHLEYQLKQLERQLLSEEAKLAAVRNLDATVKALRSSKPKLNLRKALNLTHPLQVRVILSSSLSLLTRLGEKNQAARVADLKKRVTAVKAQLKDVSGVVRQQLLDLKKSHGQARHTLV